MKNRLIQKTAQATKNKEKVFCAFLTCGYPGLASTEKLVEQFEKVGVDVVELGFPFSDPLADGPTIQFSSEKALEKGVRIQDVLAMVKRLRKKGVQVPMVFFTYLNPIYHYGLKRFVQDAAKAGLDGVLVPDMPPEEEKEFSKHCQRRGLAQVFLMAPTTEPKRMTQIDRHSQGFIYYVSLRGVTGARKSVSSDVKNCLKKIKRKTQKPVLIGFGVSSPKQAQSLASLSEGVIVGSAIIEVLRKNQGQVGAAVKFVQKMVRAAKNGSASRT